LPHPSGYLIIYSAAKENRSKLLRLRYAIFSNHYRHPFYAAINRSMKNKPAKLGQKSTATQKVEHGIYWHRQNTNLARRPSGQGAGQEGLILTPFQPCQSIHKRHTNSGASAAHDLPIYSKVKRRAF
jgi:hypothetical protein